MVGSKADYDRMTTIHEVEVGDEPPRSPDPAFVSCSICLDDVLNDAQRACAKLICGHQFHLDCIGSAFNMKGLMQCPNCRMVENGHWLYANDAACDVPEYSVDEWTPDMEPYELAFPELPFRMHWCPYGGLARHLSMLEDVDTSSAMYHGLPEHALFVENSAASTESHSYANQIGQPPLSNSTDSLEEPVFSHHWNVITHGEIPVPHCFPIVDFQYQSWIHHPLPISGHIDGADQVRNPTSVMRPELNESVTRSTSSTHALLLGQGSSTRALGPFLPSVTPLPPGRSHERIFQSLHPVFQQFSSAPVIPSMQSNGHVNFYQRQSVVSTPSSHPDQNGAYYGLQPPAVRNLHEVLHTVPSHMYPWDHFLTSPLDSVDLHQSSLHQAESGNNNRPDSVWQRHWW